MWKIVSTTTNKDIGYFFEQRMAIKICGILNGLLGNKGDFQVQRTEDVQRV